MLRIENVKVYDLAESVIASGYAMGLNLDDFKGRAEAFQKYVIDKGEWIYDFIKYHNKKKSDGWSFDHICKEKGILEKADVDELKQVLADLNRIGKLVQASKNSKDVKCHHNFMTGIRVSFDIVYPNYISPEMQRYHWFDIVTSSSKMHRITKMDFDKCCNEYVTQETKDNMKKYIKEYNDLANMIVPSSVEYTDRHSKEMYKAFMKVISNCPQGVELFMRVSTNYMQLQTMYNQRKNHKLREDWGNFCKFVEGLPLAEMLILGE